MNKFAKLVCLVLTISVSIVLAAGCGGAAKSDNSTSAKKVDYPTKPIKIIVPVPPGGDTDYNARVLAEYMQKYIGKPVVVVNISGGATVIGMKEVLNGPADGYSIVVNGTDIFVPKMMGSTDISVESFKTAGITILDNSTVLAVHKDSGFKTLPDLIAASKKAPNQIEYGMKIGATNQICGIAMGKEWGSLFKNVDVGNNAAKMTALLARQTNVININYSVAKGYFKSGEFIPLVLLGSEKNPLLPNVPLASQYGLKNLDFSKFFWLGMHPQTPDEIVKIVAGALKKATEDPGYKEKMNNNYLTVKYMAPKEAHDFAIKFYQDTMLPYKDEFLKKK